MSNIANLQFNPPKEQLNKHSFRIFINNLSKPKGSGKPEFRILLPRLCCSYGLQSFESNKDKYCFTVTFGADPNQEEKDTLQQLIGFEEKLLDYMTYKSSNFFGKSFTRDAIKKMYKSFLKYDLDSKTGPSIQIRVENYQKSFTNLTIVDGNKTVFTSPNKQSPLPFIRTGEFLACEIHFREVWGSSFKKEFGVLICARHIQVLETTIPPVIKDACKEKEETVEVEEFEINIVEINNKTYYCLNIEEETLSDGTEIAICSGDGKLKIAKIVFDTKG